MGFRFKKPKGGVDVDGLLTIMAKHGVIIDVRTPAEYESGHIPGARLIDTDTLDSDPIDAIFGADPLAEPDATPVIVVCDNGLRSSTMARRLREAGLDAYFLAGGLFAWVSAGEFLLPGPPR